MFLTNDVSDMPPHVVDLSINFLERVRNSRINFRVARQKNENARTPKNEQEAEQACLLFPNIGNFINKATPSTRLMRRWSSILLIFVFTTK